MKFNFRKIASGLASTAMVGSTVALAAAASYPAPFVDGGAADVTVVFGNDFDMSAVIDISDSLGSAFLAQSDDDTSVTIGDDFAELGRSNDRLNLGNAMNAAHTSLDEDDMDLLAAGTYTADDNDDFDYEQKITLAATTMTHFRDSEYEDLVGLDDRTPVVGYKITDGSLVMNYSIDFSDQPESDVVSGDMDDFEGSDITILGKEYYVSDFKNGSSTTTFGKVTLLDSANKATVKEDETKTVNVGGVDYVVSIDYIDSDSASLIVNGEISDNLAVGATEKLDDDSYLGIRDIRKLEVAGELGTVEFSIGSGKLELTSGSDVVMNDDSIADVKAWFKTTTGPNTKLNEVIITWHADGDLFVTEENPVVMPGFESVQYSMRGLERTDEETITIENDGDDSMELSVPIKDGTATFNILYANSSGEFTGIGKSATERLATSPNTQFVYYDRKGSAEYHEYVVASYASGKDSESYLLRIKTNLDNGVNETTITNVLDSTQEWKDRRAGDVVDIGDVSITIDGITHSAANKNVTLSAGTNVNFSTLYTDSGLKMYLPWESAGNVTTTGAINFSNTWNGNESIGHDLDSFYLLMDGRDKDSTNEGGTGFNVTINDNSDGELEVSQVNIGGNGGSGALEIGSSNSFEKYIVDDVAPRIVHHTNGDQDYAEVFYPTGEDAETYADLVLASLGSTDGESVTSLGSVHVKDTELASSGMAENNLIVVGGSCVNSVAASLLNGAGCESSWEAATDAGVGQYVVETFAQDNGKIATLVAGWNAEDTADAATFLTTGEVSTDAGSKYIDGALVA